MEAYFVEPSRTMHAIKPDSTRLIIGDSVYFHFRTVGFTTNPAPCNGDPMMPSWTGLKTVIHPDGENVFFNRAGDSLHIFSKAMVGNSWKLYAYSNGNYLQASITSVAITNVLSIPDSIKVVSLQAYDNMATPIANSFNGKQIVLSKAHGIIQFYNIFNFPQDTTSYRIIAGHRLTYGEVYDFQIGDVFEHNISYNNGPPTTIVRKVIGKALWTDSVRYTFVDTTYTRTLTGCCTINSFSNVNTYSVLYAHLSLPINGPYLPEQSSISANSAFDYSMKSGNGNCDPLSISNCDYDYLVYQSSCWGEAFEPVYDCLTYTAGLGEIRTTNYTTIGGNSSDETIVYVKKGALVCGAWVSTPAGILENPSLNELNLSLYPNPVSSSLTITWSVSMGARTCEFEIFNSISGKSVQSVKWEDSSGTGIIDISSLSAGIYFVRLKTGNFSLNSKFVKE